MINGTVNNALVRSINAKVELYNGSTLASTFTDRDKIISISIERIGEENRFFGFGICQKLSLKLIDLEREISVTTANSGKVAFSDGGEYVSAFPVFYVTETHRDETTNQLSITAYDAVYGTAARVVAELGLSTYTIREFAEKIAETMGLSLDLRGFEDVSPFDLYYDQGANYEGTESLRDALNDIAEATQSIYFVTESNLVFLRLSRDGGSVFTIDKEKYFELDSSTNRRLARIVKTTELGDEVFAELEQSGTTQFIRDNAFLDMREDIAEIVDNALAAVGGLTLNQFECTWRGSLLLEIGDKLEIITKDNSSVYSFLLDDVVEYDGAYQQRTRWKYTDNEAETATNPTSLGEAVKQTYARVDKINKEVSLLASETDQNSENIANLQINTTNISATVQKVEKQTSEAIEEINKELSEITKQVELKLSEEDLTIKIEEILQEGVDKVVTNTGYTFDENGMTVAKTGAEMSTTISEDGMKVYKDDEAVLTANNVGVEALNLHAKTYLIIGNYSRFEDYINPKGEPRTGCFWIG